jgi:hypothetical protein
VVDDQVEPKKFVVYMVRKMDLVAQLHEISLENID